MHNRPLVQLAATAAAATFLLVAAGPLVRMQLNNPARREDEPVNGNSRA